MSMIDRERWAQIYDMARFNGYSPFDYISKVERWIEDNGTYVDPVHNEDGFYQACLEFSRSRTQYPLT